MDNNSTDMSPEEDAALEAHERKDNTVNQVDGSQHLNRINKALDDQFIAGRRSQQAEIERLSKELEAANNTLSFMRPEIYRFARDMEQALRHKDTERGGNSWQVNMIEDEVYSHLIDRLDIIAPLINLANFKANTGCDDMEVNEAFCDVAKQAIHLGNFAMMLADIAQPQTYRQPKTDE